MNWWQMKKLQDHDAIICDGSIRSGKTISMTVGFVLWSMSQFDDQVFAICGKTIESLRRNVILHLPKWLEGIFTVQEKRSENRVTIAGLGRRNTYFLFGGKDEGSAALIQGMTLTGVLFDEVALMPRSFVEQAMARCSVEGSRYWFNCNPESPNHWFYTEWIKDDQSSKKNALHLHFTMDDNLTLSPKVRNRYERQYAGIFYDRFIRGEWSVASGAIYGSCFSGKNIRRDAAPYDRCFVSVDYGTQNPCVFHLIRARQKNGQHQHYVEKEYYYDGRHSQTGQKTDEQYSKDMRDFIGGEKIECIIVDPSAASLITQLRKDGWYVIPARNAVMQGISAVSVEFSNGDLLIDPSCKNTIREVSGYVWDEKAREHGEDKPVKVDDHTCDALRYGVYTDVRRHPIGFKTNTYRG